jgi:hypothetical protein
VQANVGRMAIAPFKRVSHMRGQMRALSACRVHRMIDLD